MAPMLGEETTKLVPLVNVPVVDTVLGATKLAIWA